MFKRFKVKYKGKVSIVRAENALKALEKFCNREFFGHRRVWDYDISQVDADTRGKIWVEAYTRGDDKRLRIMVSETK